MSIIRIPTKNVQKMLSFLPFCFLENIWIVRYIFSCSAHNLYGEVLKLNKQSFVINCRPICTVLKLGFRISLFTQTCRNTHQDKEKIFCSKIHENCSLKLTRIFSIEFTCSSLKCSYVQKWPKSFAGQTEIDASQLPDSNDEKWVHKRGCFMWHPQKAVK